MFVKSPAGCCDDLRGLVDDAGLFLVYCVGSEAVETDFADANMVASKSDAIGEHDVLVVVVVFVGVAAAVVGEVAGSPPDVVVLVVVVVVKLFEVLA